jgi:hypothetical protein
MKRSAYVYILFRPDGTPCYVGKGHGDRWLNHERYPQFSTNKNLANLVRKSKLLGHELPKVIIRRNVTDKKAFEIEKAFIKAIGRKVDGGPLVNFTLGGEGTSGHKGRNHWNGKTHPKVSRAIGVALKGREFSKESRRKMSESAKKRERGIGGKYSAEHAAAISAGVARYWERRRQQGLPMTNRTEAGHKKHSVAMLARYANRDSGTTKGGLC